MTQNCCISLNHAQRESELSSLHVSGMIACILPIDPQRRWTEESEQAEEENEEVNSEARENVIEAQLHSSNMRFGRIMGDIGRPSGVNRATMENQMIGSDGKRVKLYTLPPSSMTDR